MNQNKKKILITGSHSLLGKYLVEELRNDFKLILTTHCLKHTTYKILNTKYNLDITNPSEVHHTVNQYQPDFVIHLAAVSNIDFCEKNQQLAHQVNVQGTKNIINTLKGSNTLLFFLSSSMVFDGKNSPYKEMDQPNPINYYGRTKYTAEQLIQNSDVNSIIIRSSTMYGIPPSGARDNDYSYYLKKLSQSQPLYLVNDRWYNPVPASFVARVIRELIADKSRKNGEIFHIGGADRTNRYDFVKALIKVAKIAHPPKLIPVAHDYFSGLAPRPIDITLSTIKIQRKFGLTVPTIYEGIINFSKEFSDMK